MVSHPWDLNHPNLFVFFRVGWGDRLAILRSSCPYFPGTQFWCKSSLFSQPNMTGFIYAHTKIAEEEGREISQAHWILKYLEPKKTPSTWSTTRWASWTPFIHIYPQAMGCTRGFKKSNHQRNPPIWEDPGHMPQPSWPHMFLMSGSGAIGWRVVQFLGRHVGRVEVWAQIQKIPNNTGVCGKNDIQIQGDIIQPECSNYQNDGPQTWYVLSVGRLGRPSHFSSPQSILTWPTHCSFQICTFDVLTYLGILQGEPPQPLMVAGYLTCLQLKSFFETGAAWTKHECLACFSLVRFCHKLASAQNRNLEVLHVESKVRFLTDQQPWGGHVGRQFVNVDSQPSSKQCCERRGDHCNTARGTTILGPHLGPTSHERIHHHCHHLPPCSSIHHCNCSLRGGSNIPN